MCQEKFNNLLSEIDKQLLVSRKISQERGEDFNIFRIIRMGTKETSVHSAFLADLLNPYGQHSAGDVFLRLFIDCIFPDFVFNTETSIVKLEKDIGKITATSGGRIDLILTDNNGKAIIIENKIYAEDQDRQMLRYYNYANDNFPGNFQLLYLSLDGTIHDKTKTTGGRDIPFSAISYRDDIIPWLDCCLKEVVEKPLIREGIIHYRNLLKYLTHTYMNAETRKALAMEVLKEQAHIENINNYVRILGHAKRNLLESFWENLFLMSKKEFKEVSFFERENMKCMSYPEGSENIFGKKFKFGHERRTYDYQFGIQTKIKDLGNGYQLMLGMIVDKRLSIRLFIVGENKELLPINQSHLGLDNSWINTKRKDYLLKYLPGDEEWNLAELPDETLMHLSKMKESIESIVEEFIKTYNNLILQLKNS